MEEEGAGPAPSAGSGRGPSPPVHWGTGPACQAKLHGAGLHRVLAGGRMPVSGWGTALPFGMVTY